VLLVDDTTLGGFSDATGLHGTTHGVGNGASRSSQSRVREPSRPGVFDTVNLKRGLADAALLDEHRRLAIVWHLSHAWVIHFASPTPSTDCDVVTVALLDLAHEGITLVN